MDDVYRNTQRSVTNPLLKARNPLEAYNGSVDQIADQRGIFKTHNSVKLSLVGSGNLRELVDAGFFPETMSAAFQVTGENADGELEIEPVFVAGASEINVEDELEKNPGVVPDRFDIAAVVVLGKKLGVDFSGKSPNEILKSSLFIRKELMPNGGIDIAKMYDDAVEEVTGVSHFFGHPHTGEKDYIAHREFCLQREASFDDAAERTVARLAEESDDFVDQDGNIMLASAAKRLNELNSAELRTAAVVTDRSIATNVFGSIVAENVVRAREYYDAGNMEAFHAEMSTIKEKGRDGSCPNGLAEKNQGPTEGEQGGPSADQEMETGTDQYGSRKFKCPKGHENERPHNTLISNCVKCGCDVSCGNEKAIDIRPYVKIANEDVGKRISVLEQMLL